MMREVEVVQAGPVTVRDKLRKAAVEAIYGWEWHRLWAEKLGDEIAPGAGHIRDIAQAINEATQEASK